MSGLMNNAPAMNPVSRDLNTHYIYPVMNIPASSFLVSGQHTLKTRPPTPIYKTFIYIDSITLGHWTLCISIFRVMLPRCGLDPPFNVLVLMSTLHNAIINVLL